VPQLGERTFPHHQRFLHRRPGLALATWSASGCRRCRKRVYPRSTSAAYRR
jgi:hypothetical protein